MLEQVYGLSIEQFIGFVLVFLRISATISVGPVLGSQSIPPQIKVFFSLFLTIVFLPMIKVDAGLTGLGMRELAPLAIKEVFLGLFLGFNAKLIFESFQIAGRLISAQMGLGMANLIDPESGAPVTPIGNIYSMLAIVFFLSFNGHHFVISALYKSFDLSPVSSLRMISIAGQQKMLSILNELFVIGVKLAAPSIATLFLIEACMGIMARIVPQMNIFFIGLPIRLGVGLFVVIASFSLFYILFSSIYELWKRDIIGITSYF